jgi:16S rRNA (cytidine1402-2'-O)-methyltransferase
MKKGKLYLVGLPVGNWEDMPPRALRYIKEAKNIVIEREEAFAKIWPALGIQKPDVNIISIEMQSRGGEPGRSYELENLSKVINLLESGEDVYLISDDGMPGVADPGELITKEAIKGGFEVTATPGPSAVLAAVSVAGCQHNFYFGSFLPHGKEERIQYLNNHKNINAPMVFMLRSLTSDENGKPMFHPEIPNFLEDAINVLGDRNAVLCYNLTKDNERVVRGTFSYLLKYFNETPREEDLIMIVIDTQHGSLKHMGIFSDTRKN